MGLTKRQTQIVSLLAEGNTAEEVGLALHRSCATVRRHIAMACDRVDARNVTHLVAKALSEGWIKLLCLVLVIAISGDLNTDDMRRPAARLRIQRTNITRTTA